MKAKLLIPQQQKNPKYSAQAHQQMLDAGRIYSQKKYEWRPVGTEIEDPKVWRLVLAGTCEAADEECQQAVVAWCRAHPKRAPEVEDWGSAQPYLKQCREDHKKVLKGIHPDDYDKFEMGEISGYAPDGSYILGQNAMPDSASILGPDGMPLDLGHPAEVE